MKVKNIHRLDIKAYKSHDPDPIRFYWRKESFETVKTILRRFSSPGDMVLDPFCGSGTTGLAAASLNRKAFLSDISPASIIMAKAFNEKIPDHHMADTMKKIMPAVRKLRQALYGCRCPRCGDGNAHIAYSVFKTVFHRPWFEFWPATMVIHCKSCGSNVFEPFNRQKFSLDITRLRYDRIFSGLNQKALQCLKNLVDEIREDEWIYPKLNAVFMSTVYQGSLYRQKNGKVSYPAHQVFPEWIYEKNCCDIFEAKAKSLMRFNHTLPNGNKISLQGIRVGLKPAWNLADIGNQSIDLCYYDIPYGSDFIFSRLNAIWEVWLDQKTDQSEDIFFQIDNPESYGQYYRKLLPVFKEAFRVAKPRCNLLIPFSPRYGFIYPYIEKAVFEAGFRTANSVRGGLTNHIRIFNGRSHYFLLNFSK